MSSNGSCENGGGFNPSADTRLFHAGIGIHPIDSIDPFGDQNIATLSVQLWKLGEEVDEVNDASLNTSPEHTAEEAVDVAYVAIGLLDLFGQPYTTLPPLTNDAPANTNGILERHSEVLAAYSTKDYDAFITGLRGLADESLQLTQALGFDSKAMWAAKHEVNVAKYPAELYAQFRKEGCSHQDALQALKDSWPARRASLEHASLPIDMGSGQLVL